MQFFSMVWFEGVCDRNGTADQRFFLWNRINPCRLISNILLATTQLLASEPAHAQFSVCNQTLDVVNVAIGRFDAGEFETSGWWTVGPNQCANVVETQLSARYLYAFAQDVFGRIVLAGAKPMCVAPGKFEIRGETDCLVRGFLEARFLEVDTRRSERWTLFLYPPK